MSQRITIDPVTRIEGHLRIDCEIEDGKVVKAWSSGTMWRGMEEIVKGNDPRDAWMIVQRICGVCTTIHALASVRAVENALGMEVPINAQYIRNIIAAAHSIHDHIVHFYQLSALDWVDVTSALQADPKKAADLLKGLSNWPLNSEAEFAQVQQKIKNLVGSGQLGIFANGYWGHPAMSLPPEINLIAVAHYLQALECQRDANRIVAILGGKTPHIQNLAVGGVANPINLDSPGVLNLERLMYLKSFIDRLGDFIEQVYLVDTAVIAAHYPEWFTMGRGADCYLCVPELPVDRKSETFLMPGGFLDNGKFRPINNPHDEYLLKGIEESGKHAWYQDDQPLAPWEGLTRPNYTGWQDDGKYSWVKSPTFYGNAVEMGPLAWLLCNLRAGYQPAQHYFTRANDIYKALTGNVMTEEQLPSTLGRVLGRTVHACVLHDTLAQQWQALVTNIGNGDHETFIPPNIPEQGEFRGVGFIEAPRGALSHWVVIKDGKIANYQAVVPSTWNAGPRNFNNEPGPYERSLVGTPVADPYKPLEVVRTIHSFDPCMSCAVHLVDTSGQEVTKVRVL
ncbi:hydrogenase-2 large subunit [Pectobacterium atrosepticum SCRI1043]|uniref:hydrogenase (acceptor) n=1 Tax=Pectobacterium atrosepticum (strain SCRI 1043 / ATCC BAA-672) TaxID=218491 RepID=Q6D7U7_PECAS|nr:hydrogenase 2 large subunit [Pectobacterium atrosepticum]GKV86406.1 hydrogenase 2 large subunit [Pectobacterium carotovorum subsp. carotovorum]AIA70185.1 hydrogenase 2 large subunit [Pectobacterium atrosepticum]AIK13105.1 hydrogenase-2 large subunit [Pectobacterium atrosepticum]ATY90016.1 hydrogenase 2 large subunit [Pectobacterium atrosepticum]KFX16930.1 hydrogenase 2 large subunit [Pectobacterium atrosepticum]